MKHSDGIVITRGDDSNAFNRNITIRLNTELDLTGYSAIFQIGCEQWVFDNIADKVLNIIINKEQSMRLHEGTHYAALKIFEPSGLCMTMFRNIPVYVEEIVVRNPVE